MNITVTCVNDPPSGTDKAITIDEDHVVDLHRLRLRLLRPSDTPSNGFAGVKIVTVPTATNGLLKLNGSNVAPSQSVTAAQIADGDLTYEPVANGCGSPYASFRVVVRDDGGTANGGSDTDPSYSEITINVTCVEDDPTAVEDLKTVAEDDPATTIDVLANDTDPDGGTKQVASITNPAHGSVAITNSGADLTYTPNADYCGPDSFTYTLNGGSTATVNITVTCVKAAPRGVSAGGPYTISEGDPLTLQGSATDRDGDPITYSWDVNGDGDFGDASGANPTLSWAKLQSLGISDGPAAFKVRVKATDPPTPRPRTPPT